MRASDRLHHKALGKVLSAPMRYFDTTPLGSLVQRFSSDLDQVKRVNERNKLWHVHTYGLQSQLQKRTTPRFTNQPPHTTQVDQQLPGTLGMFITCVLQILGAMAAVLTATPAFALAIFPLSWVRTLAF